MRFNMIEEHPIPIQVFVLTIRLWFSSMILESVQLCLMGNFLRFTNIIERLSQNISACLALVMCTQRIGDPLGHDNRVVKGIIFYSIKQI